MARIIYGMLTSLDGYISGPEGGPGLPGPFDELHKYFNEETKRTSAAIYGRRMYETMRAWDDMEGEPNPVYAEFGEAWRAIPKLVVSTTLHEVGPNATLVNGDPEAAVRALKARMDGTIEIAGAGLAASLARLGLIDEYRLYMQPVVLGGGKPFFEARLSLTLEPLGAESLPEGCTLLRYTPAA